MKISGWRKGKKFMKLKKILSLALAVSLSVVALVGCGETADTSVDGGNETSTSTANKEAAATPDESTGSSSGAELRIAAQPYPLYTPIFVAYE